MKVRLYIHSDINNDDESREVEQRGTKRRAKCFFFFLCVCAATHYVGILYAA